MTNAGNDRITWLPPTAGLVPSSEVALMAGTEGSITPQGVSPRLVPRMPPELGALHLHRADGSTTPRQVSDRSPRAEPFSMPTMEPLARQQGLLFEQSELLREQFLKFAESLQRLHGTVEELREDLLHERQQRLQDEESLATSIAQVRQEADSQLWKQQEAQKQLEQRLLDLREEVALRARAADGEMQRINARHDTLRSDHSNQMSAQAEEHRMMGHGLKAKMADLQDALTSHRASSATALEDNRKSLQMEAAETARAFEEKYTQAHQALEAQVAQVEGRRLAAEPLLHASISALRTELTDVIKASEERAASSLQQFSQQVQEYQGHCLQEVRAEEVRAEAAEVSLKTSGEQALQEMSVMMEGIRASLATMMKDQITRVEAEAAVEAERQARSSAELLKMNEEFESDRRQHGISVVGMVTELGELRAAVAREVQTREATTGLLGRWVEETRELQQTMLAEEMAHASLSDTQSRNKEEAEKSTAQLRTSLESALETGLAAASDDFRMGREELWHVFNSLQDRHSHASLELSELERRTAEVETERLGQLSQQLVLLGTMNGQVTAKLEKFEKTSLQENVDMTKRLDILGYDVESTKTAVQKLIEQPAQVDYLESANSQFRLSVSAEGDIAVHRRNGWGKYGNDFGGVPRWHAGASIGDRPLCCVNREMQPHEKDRFLAMANRQADSAA